jgi:dihydrofolate synthase / folylpolyglutamate synthase
MQSLNTSPCPLADANSSLDDWLVYAEHLHPVSIDLGLDRVKTVANRLSLHLTCPVITVAGTNGKGSTCAMLDSILRQAGYKVGVYTSPHLVHFEERLRIADQPVSTTELVAAFVMVERSRGQNDAEVSLTFFEFTTLAILLVMAQSDLDVAILEVGLGGRLDAVNIIDADCVVITSIDMDHVAFLGTTREAIGHEKAGIMRTGRPAVISDPLPPQSVLDHAKEVGADVWRVGVDFNVTGDQQQWAWAGRGRRYGGLAFPALRGGNQLVNAAGVLAALTALRDVLPVSAQAVRTGLAFVQLPGRFQVVPGQPVLVLDVAHNPHAVATLAVNLDAMGFFPVTHAIFGVMADKDMSQMLVRMNPLIDRWYFTDLPTERAALASDVMSCWQIINTPQDVHHAQAACFQSPEQALKAVLEAANPTDRILVFGSFYAVGDILKKGVPQLQAQHLPKS